MAIENKYRNIFAAAKDGIIITDSDGHIADWNPAMEEISGKKKTEVVGRLLSEVQVELIPMRNRRPETIAGYKETLKRIFEQKVIPPKPSRTEELLRSDGTTRFIDSAVFPIRAGEEFSICAIIRDVTETTEKEAEMERNLSALAQGEEIAKTGYFERNWLTGEGYWSDGFCSLLGIEPGSVLPHEGFMQFVHDEDRQRVADHVSERTRSGKPMDIEFRIRKTDGEIIHIHGRAETKHTGEGIPLRTRGTFIDITDTVASRKKIAVQNQYLQTILETTQDGFWVVDTTGTFLDVNTAYCRFSGYTRDEFLGLRIGDIDADESPEETAARIERIIKNGHELFETRHRKKDGTVFEVEVSAAFLPEGDGKFICFSRDISRRKQMEMDLRRSEERFRLAMDSAKEGLWDWDVKANSVYFSPGYFAILGYEYDDTIKTHEYWLDLIHPDDVEKALGGSEAVIEGKQESFETELQVRHQDGTYRIILDRGKCVSRDQDGKALRIVGSHMDLTRIREAERELRELVRQKELLMQELGHRVKNNLNVTAALLRMKARAVSDKELEMELEGAMQRIYAVSSMYEKLYVAPDFIVVDVRSHIDTLVDYARQIFMKPFETNGDYPVRFVLSIDDIVLGSAQTTSLGLILNELIVNAIKYAYPGREGGEIRISLTQNSRSIFLTVEDDGTGLPEDFDTEKSGNLGFELIRMLVKQLKGTLEIDGTNGTRVNISFQADKVSIKSHTSAP